MTQKDFELIAATIAKARDMWKTPAAVDSHPLDALSEVARDFADELAATNPRFKRDVFLRACGVES